MSNAIRHLIPILLLICLSALLCCALFSPSISFASDDKESLVIKAEFVDDNIVWAATASNNAKVWDYTGEFVSDDAILSLKRELAQRLRNNGKIDYDTFESFYASGEWICHDYFDVSFDFPHTSASALDKTQTEYTLLQSPIVIRADFERAVSASPMVCLEYNNVGSTDKYRTPLYEPYDVTFGNGVDVGEYEVVCVVIEAFRFDGKDYNVERRAQSSIRCTVTKANLRMEIGEVVIPYGTSVANIGDYIYDCVISSGVADVANGTFKPSDIQEDSVFNGVANKNGLLLNVKEGSYTLNFDYEHNSGNFNPLTNIKIKVKVNPKQIIVKIADLYSLVGDELLSMGEVKYYLLTPLAGGDEESDLGISFDCNPDNTAVGTYLITAKFSNGNYTPKSESQTSDFIDGGRYMVFAKSISALSPDGNKFTVYFEKGFVEIKSVVIECIDAQSPVEDKEIVRAYRVLLADNDGNPVEVEGNYYVSWETSDATWVSVGLDVQSILAIDGVANGLALDKDNNEIYFYADVVKEEREGVLTWQIILLFSLCCIVFVATIVSVHLRARAEVKRFEKYVYVRETDDKAPICANNVISESDDDSIKSNDETVARDERES